MTDLEIVKRCAEKMGLNSQVIDGAVKLSQGAMRGYIFDYNPLTDDAQAMALVKKFGLMIDAQHDFGVKFEDWPGWEVTHPSMPDEYLSISEDLNRAICECVARLP